MSWAGGWFFLMASEQFTLGSRSYQLPGLGSYLQAAANAGNTGALILGLFTLVLLIVLLDLVFWRPLVAWADKFKVELSSGADEPHSFVLDTIRRSAIVAVANRRVFRPLGSLTARFLNCLQPLAKEEITEKEQVSRRPSLRQIVNIIFVLLLIVLVLLGLWELCDCLSRSNLPCGVRYFWQPFNLVTYSHRLTHRCCLDGTRWCGDWTFTTLVTSFATRCPGGSFHSSNSALPSAVTCTDWITEWSLLRGNSPHAPGDAMVYPFQCDSGSHGYSERLARGDHRLPCHFMEALAQTHSPGNFPLPHHGFTYSQWWGVERQYCLGVRPVRRSNAQHLRTWRKYSRGCCSGKLSCTAGCNASDGSVCCFDQPPGLETVICAC